jgi:branched-chain amino acid transport system substrate-binding protein
VCALSGGWAGFGVKPGTGFEIAAEHINENGGIKSMGGAKIKVVKGDDQGVPDRAAAEAERLITLEDVAAIVGIWPTSIPVSDQAERYSCPALFPLTIARITERGYKYSFHGYCKGADEAEQEMMAMVQACRANGIEMPKTVYMEYISDDCSVTNAQGFRDECNKWGVEIVGDEIVEIGAPSYASLLAKIENADPDLLFSCHYTGGAITLYREIMEREMYFPHGIMSWGGGIEDQFFYDSVPPAAYAYAWSQENGDPLMWKRPWFDYINDRVVELIDVPWSDSHFVSTYCCLWQIKDALERTVWDPDLATFRNNLRDAVAATDITQSTGEQIPIPGTDMTFVPALDPLGWVRVKYDEYGQNTYRAGMMVQIINGIKWPFYPEVWIEPDGPDHAVLPIPPWSERYDQPAYYTGQ